ncbi:MAG: queuosine precursor transporter [Clostridia bacterium]|nr:queuosine precursor transporter [Clostridia bacterium]
MALEKKDSLHAVVALSVLYVAAQMLADITSLRIILFFGLSMDAGTLIYPITFTLRDLVHKTAGLKVARLLIFLAAGINLFMAGLFWLVAILPPDPAVGLQKEFGLVLSPVFRITIASIIAEVVAELIDGQVYEIWVRRFGRRYQWGRVLASNLISVPVDSFLFATIAFAGALPPKVIFSIFLANVLVKLFIALLSVPAIYFVREKPVS